MDNLRTSIALFFRRINTENVLAELNEFDLCNKPFQFQIKRIFLQFGREIIPHYSKDEWENIIQKLDEDWLHDVYGEKDKSKSIFNLLLHFSKQALLIENNQPVVNDEFLLRWRELSYEVGEDLLTCAHLSYMDSRARKKRSFYAWKPVVSTNNHRLKNILEQGIAENHFHLKGSAPIFSLSWISLMNQITGRKAEFDRIEKLDRQVTHHSPLFGSNELKLSTQVQMAALIRKELFKLISGIPIDKKISNKITTHNFHLELIEHQSDIGQLKFLHGLDFYHNGKKVVADYAIPKKLHAFNFKSNVLLCGERIFLYNCLKRIYEGDTDFKPYINLFYLYLVIKEKLREELIQVNRRVGFANFSDYQDRKEFFIAENSIYETAFLSTAVKDSAINQNISHFETRIAPKCDKDHQINAIKKYDKDIDSDFFNPPTNSKLLQYFLKSTQDSRREFPNFYVLHFIKENLNKASLPEYKITQNTISRDYKLRKKVEQEAKAIVRLKESTSKTAQRIYGIDAASSEITARPEVFAQVFRYLKDYKYSGRLDHLKEDLIDHPLGATYHVGEDFLDLVDGLRAIDETILFLKFRKGDRLGHALALGIEPKTYYSFKNQTLLLPKQNLLDNTAWLIEKQEEFGLVGHEQEIARLKSQFQRLFLEVYTTNITQPNRKHHSINTYLDAWRLRGDAPELYRDWGKDPNEILRLTFWDRCKINYTYPLNTYLRQKNSDARFLYHTYHYNAEVKEAGSKIIQQKITPGHVRLVTDVQQRLLENVAKKEIAIECNPTSNYLIGTFKRYAKHPIERFYNLGLTYDSEKLNQSPQLMVSINTDDQGVFSTSLENEYALLAIALKKETDENGKPLYNTAMIYDWLDRIRKMGIEMSFYKR